MSMPLLKELKNKVTELENGKINKKLTTFSGDLNDIKETSYVYALGSASNIPVANFGYYVTTIVLNENYIIQKADRITTSGIISHERQRTNTGWTIWKACRGNITPLTNDNFNNLTNNGVYYFSASPSGENKPCTTSGMLEVFTSDNGNLITQRYTEYTGAKMYIRGCYLNSWSSWREL